ncbi:putative bifunctional diguanylate cyclase/phosphodiesterase [Sphingomonas sp. PAMC 26617]|uniref:putative bifunctional diguanylate cyclase/phosphodiesterase n=1 Tax=Sphingomonas sp. PAMC 26617 TaxID=1112216 RepID=UPI0004952E2B|nr:EAL domain-containing protein [Sphingomonas sp. PAMC 26617]
MKHALVAAAPALEQQLARAERIAQRERAARLEAERIAEHGLRTLYESKQRLQLLQHITELANSARTIPEALDAALEMICERMSWTVGNVLMVSHDLLRVEACDIWRATDAADVMAFVEASRRMPFGRGEGLPGRVFARGRSEWITDPGHSEHFLRADVAARCGLGTGCAFPVLAGNDVVAVLEFYMRQAVPEDTEIIGILEQAGIQLGRVFERDRAQRALVHDALHDPLTRLPNRALFSDRLQASFDRLAPPRRHALAVMVLDLDGFKLVNDSLGHHAGDRVLIRVADILRDTLARLEGERGAHPAAWRASPARMGGDEFTILVEDLAGEDLAAHGTIGTIATALHDALQDRLGLVTDIAPVGTSIGFAIGNALHANVDHLLRDADLAMYEAKAGGRGRTIGFTEALGETLRDRARLTDELRAAIENRQFELDYQPIVTLDASRSVCGFEALVRWNHPLRGRLLPAEFIDVAETSGLILFLGDWVLREACATAASWPMRDGVAPFISINISARQFAQPGFAARVRQIVLETGVDPTRIRLELTESTAIVDIDHTCQVIEEIRRWGVQTSLDDFGTGFSSLSSLHRLPFDVLKIDRSFVMAMDGHGKGDGIVRAIVALARTIGMTIVAEGIETPAQAELLIELGCELGQGYHFGRPAVASHAATLLAPRDAG